MISTEQTAEQAAELPASAYPEGVDPSTYLSSLKGETPETASTEGQRPAHIPEKFWDEATKTVRVDDLVKSYAELETKQRAPKAEPDKVDALTIPKPEAPAEGETNPFVAALETFEARYTETEGKLTEDDVKALVEVGMPQKYIDNYLAGLEALQERQMQQVFAVTGGEEKLGAALQWAATGLTAAEIDSYDSLVTNPKTATQAVEWLMSKYNATAPAEGSFIEAEAGAAVGDVFRSKAEFQAALQDDRYFKGDRAYRASVEEKLARSKAAGVF